MQGLIELMKILVSSCRPLKRIIEETEAGLVFQAGDPEGLAEKIVTLYKSSELRQKMGNRGRMATVEGKYNWKYSGGELIGIYKNFCNYR